MQTHYSVASIRKMTRADVLSVGSRLRAADVEEITLNGRKNRYVGLLKGLEPDHTSFTVLVKNIPSALFGIGPSPAIDILEGSSLAGLVWFVATPLVFTDARLTFGKASFKVLDSMLKDNPQYPFVYNAIHGDNIAAIGWLDRLGFTFVRTFYVYEMLFHLALKTNPYYIENV
jgi:hypothetical protein